MLGILDGRKSHITRVVKAPPIPCPFGQVGDRLWVRESFTFGEEPDGEDFLIYKADDARRSLSEWKYPHAIYDYCVGRFGKTIPSIHMPRWASRITLEITGSAHLERDNRRWVWTIKFRKHA